MNDRLFEFEPPTWHSSNELTSEKKAEYRRRLAEKLRDPAFRSIEGFPIGTDEAILALSDPPNYTACPNPFIDEWLSENAKPYDPETDNYHRVPFAADVSEGKSHPIYSAHGYHTKVPHRAIMRYVLHYTEPGEVVYDGFCGTGMTGVAAQLCGDKAEVEALGSDSKSGTPGDYKVDGNGNIWDRAAWESNQAIRAGRPNPHPFLTDPQPFSKLGARKAILNDLSPSATFIAYNYNAPVDAIAFELEAKRILADSEAECGWMYTTLHREPGKWNDAEWDAFVAQAANELSKCTDVQSVKAYLLQIGQGAALGHVEFMVWSDVLLCPQCAGDIVFFDAASDPTSGAVAESFPCPTCRAEVTKRSCGMKKVSVYDRDLDRSVSVPAQEAVRITYSASGKRHEKKTDSFDLAITALSDVLPILDSFPKGELPHMHMTHERASMANKGISHIHHFHTARSRRALATLWRLAGTVRDDRLRRFVYFTVDQTIWGLSKLARFVPTHFSQVNQYLNGVYYIGSLRAEVAPDYILSGKVKRLTALFSRFMPFSQNLVLTGSCSTALPRPQSLDYIFTDPPFGENIYYADLNFLVESWYGLMTDAKPEAIVDQAKKKALIHYQQAMTACFRAYYEALKPGRWMTVEFSNSSNAVWNAIQEGLEKVGFVVADIRILDRLSGSYRQVTATSAVKQDLIISCYKPTDRFIREFSTHKGSVAGVREFVEQHLEMVPVAPITKAGKIESLTERTHSVLYDRMVGYHLVHGAPIPLSAVEFESLLIERFYKEDGMWFLPNQLASYQARKMRGAEPEQLAFYVQDEKSAVRWVRTELDESQQTLGELTPKFMRELKEWPNTEPRPELRDLMKEYFIQNLDGSWAIPDPENEEHLATLRRNQMLKLFRVYATDKGKLTSFRKEAVIEGFKHCWQTKQYGVIVKVAKRMKEADLHSDRELMQFYDVANDMTPEDEGGQLELVMD